MNSCAKQLALAALCLGTACAALPKIETYGFVETYRFTRNSGALPDEWPASVAYYGEAKGWPSLRPTMECILDTVPDRRLMSLGLVVKVRPDAEPGCTYVDEKETIICGPAPRLAEAALWRWSHVHSECLVDVERYCTPHQDLVELRTRLKQCEAI